jgi:hypothetical protein
MATSDRGGSNDNKFDPENRPRSKLLSACHIIPPDGRSPAKILEPCQMDQAKISGSSYLPMNIGIPKA